MISATTLDELIMTTCLNCRGYQLDKYNQCFSDTHVELIQEEIKNTLMSYHSKDLNYSIIIDLVKLIIQRWESNFNQTPAMILEYGM